MRTALIFSAHIPGLEDDAECSLRRPSRSHFDKLNCLIVGHQSQLQARVHENRILIFELKTKSESYRNSTNPKRFLKSIHSFRCTFL